MIGVCLRGLLMGVVILSLAACAGVKPREFTKNIDEIPEGPGLFSGEDGEFVLYRR